MADTDDTDAYFTVTNAEERDILTPGPRARSGWGDQLRGTAISGALARATDFEARRLGRGDLQLSRWSVDMFRVARMRQSVTRVQPVRLGHRLCVLDAALEQDGVAVARSRAVYLRPGATPTGQVWAGTPVDLVNPPEDNPLPPEVRMYHTPGVGWTHTAPDHQSAERKHTWHLPTQLVMGERCTPMQAMASLADVTNIVTNWGSKGVEYINVDADLAVVRLPRPDGIGLSAQQRFEHDGIAVGSAVMFDRDGPFGTALVTALASEARAVDLAATWRADGFLT